MSWSDIGAQDGKMIGSLVGDLWAAGDEEEAAKLREKAWARIDNLQLPSIEKQRLKAQLAQAEKMGPTAMEGVKVNAAYEQQQMNSLGKMNDVANANGLDAQAKSALLAAQNQNQRQRLMNEGALKQNMASRGIRGSGLELLGQLKGQQNAADQDSQAGFNAAAMGAQRAYQANSDAGALAGQMSDRSFGQQSAVANAKDRVNQFNTQTNNQFSMYNNDIKNREDQYNKELLMKQYAAQRGQAYDKEGIAQNRAGVYDAKGQRKRGIATGVGETVGRGAGMVLDMYMPNPGSMMGGGEGGGMGGMFGG